MSKIELKYKEIPAEVALNKYKVLYQPPIQNIPRLFSEKNE